MKGIYEAPELELTKLIPEKKIALDLQGGQDNESYVSDADVELPLQKP